jgi:hypothetical protein
MLSRAVVVATIGNFSALPDLNQLAILHFFAGMLSPDEEMTRDVLSDHDRGEVRRRSRDERHD